MYYTVINSKWRISLACFEESNDIFLDHDGNRYIQECTDDSPISNNVNATSFDIVVTDNIEFPVQKMEQK
ncbi:MAG: hypothetical protein ACPKQO_10070 [Nitrososphaeraceae archaeon]